MIRAPCSTILRPYMSPSFPYSGVTTVCASRYAVTTQEMCFKPPRSPTIVGSAVATIVWSSAARNITSKRPPNTSRSGTSPPLASDAMEGVAAALIDLAHRRLYDLRKCATCGVRDPRQCAGTLLLGTDRSSRIRSGTARAVGGGPRTAGFGQGSGRSHLPHLRQADAVAGGVVEARVDPVGAILRLLGELDPAVAQLFIGGLAVVGR